MRRDHGFHFSITRSEARRRSEIRRVEPEFLPLAVDADASARPLSVDADRARRKTAQSASQRQQRRDVLVQIRTAKARNSDAEPLADGVTAAGRPLQILSDLADVAGVRR